MASERPASLPRTVLIAWLAVGLLCCAGESLRRFPLQDPLWVDRDANPVTRPPAKTQTSGYALEADQTILRPISHALSVPLRTESLDVNSVDEVPDSSWFTNRIGFFSMTPDEVARGACGTTPPLDPQKGPWVVVSAKPDGSNPGFVIKAPDGERYLIKVDGALRSQRATAADVVASKIYHAAGYHTPCNEIVHFSEDILQLGPGAKRRDRYGHEVALVRADIDGILAAAWHDSDGRLRAMASRFLKGTPVGPFRYEGTRGDDPNDVVPHERRRELRANQLFAAWIHHWDASENNTLDVMVKEGGRSFVRHYILDWGDSLGDIWNWTWPRLNQRVGIGRAGYLDLDQVLIDFLTLGLYPRPWYDASPPEEPETFGYFGTQDFVPSAWRGTLANPAFREMTSRDALWATRIISRFTDEQLAAIVARAEMDRPASEFLTATLIGRRDIILREYLSRASPLDRFAFGPPQPPTLAQSFCFEDRALATKVAEPRETMYRLQLRGGARLDKLFGWRQFRPDPAHPERSCVDLPFSRERPQTLAGEAAPDNAPLRYAELVIDSNQRPSLTATARVVLHLYDLGPARGFRLVGIERPPVPAADRQ